MQRILVDHADNRRLRFVSNDSVVSFRVGAYVTSGDVARTLDEISSQRDNNPVAVDVIYAPGTGS